MIFFTYEALINMNLILEDAEHLAQVQKSTSVHL